MSGKGHTYFDMIEDAVLTLADRKGSTRQGIWKCIQAKYPEADYKQFLIRFKKIGENSNIVHASGQRIRLDPKYKISLLKKL